jgi:predicted enzyme related to lactoylglutathione lyase
MISGVHAIVFSPAAEPVRAFFRDVLGLDHVDAGGGWPIFALPPAELAVHPDDQPHHELYLLCDDLDATLAELRAKGVETVGPPTEASWGRRASLALPDGSELGIYQPAHARPGGA